ncbi:hypothetical protein HDU82_000064, partial [Entophlyctis luteolus]
VVQQQAVYALPGAQHSQQRLDIRTVSPQERKKWVEFDCEIAQNCAQVLIDFTDPSDDVAKECFMRCCDIHMRLSVSISKVDEPELVAKLISSASGVLSVIEKFNNARLLQASGEIQAAMQLRDLNLGSPRPPQTRVAFPTESDTGNGNGNGKGKGALQGGADGRQEDGESDGYDVYDAYDGYEVGGGPSLLQHQQ